MVIGKHFQLKVKILNALIPAYERMKKHNSIHDDKCPRCIVEIEDWMHVLKCKHNTKRKDFMLKLKRKLQPIQECEVQSLNLLNRVEKLLTEESSMS